MAVLGGATRQACEKMETGSGGPFVEPRKPRPSGVPVPNFSGAASAEVLPPAEIVFAGFPPGKPRIVGYCAKWQEDSFEYGRTVRQFDFSPEDRSLLDRLRRWPCRVGTCSDCEVNGALTSGLIRRGSPGFWR